MTKHRRLDQRPWHLGMGTLMPKPRSLAVELGSIEVKPETPMPTIRSKFIKARASSSKTGLKSTKVGLEVKPQTLVPMLGLSTTVPRYLPPTYQRFGTVHEGRA